uniref:RING-type E3 ubiquitin transferase n=1 Tax=Kryptolebias marmoratus TaxID=37003 RepID=A0A3Q2ZUD4_KRYMA
VAELVLLLPLLFRLRQPGADAAKLGPTVEEENWSGLNGINFIRFRENMSALEEQHTADLRAVSLNRLVLLQSFNAEGKLQKAGPPQVIWYKTSINVLKMSCEMHKLHHSDLILSSWVKRAASLASMRLPAPPPVQVSLTQICENIWNPLLQEFLHLGISIAEANITFRKLDRVLVESGDQGDGKLLRKELNLMLEVISAAGEFTPEENWVELRLAQIQKYRQLHEAAAAARAVLSIAEKMDGFSLSVIKILIKQHTACLEEFLKCHTLISWVKDNLKTMSDVKVYVDLASISAGENDTEIDQVACFHDSVMGYAPLLYSLSPQAGFSDFMKCAQQVWDAQNRDEKLPDKLRESTRLLSWLKALKETHGSVEQSSLSLASSINANGVYHIGWSDENTETVSVRYQLERGREEKRYKLEDLLELQNKLMLMSSKGEHGREQVNRFTEVFEGVQRVGAVLLQMQMSGNMLFRKWSAEVRCSPLQQPCISVTFSSLRDKQMLYQGEVTEKLHELGQSMFSCQKEWCSFVGEMRSSFSLLNHYTSEQLVFLCHWIHKVCQRQASAPQQLWHLLSPIRPQCTLTDVRAAYTNAVKESLEDLWMLFKRDMSQYLSESLDIQTLAHFLWCLSEISQLHMIRNMPSVLQEGKPNLVVCSLTEVFTTTLSFYTESPEQPLPSSDEVLVCREETTKEEVEIFLRRALCQGSRPNCQKIYSLVNPGLLGYDVSEALVELYEGLERSASPRYRLVIVSPIVHQHRCVPSYFSNNKVPAGVSLTEGSARKYLHHHFTLNTSSQNSVALVSPDQLSVWMVSSARPAVGKSLYVDRLFEKFQQKSPRAKHIRIRLIEPCVDMDSLIKSLLFCPSVHKDQPCSSLQIKLGLLDILPTIDCKPPREVKQLLSNRQLSTKKSFDPLMDEQEFCSEGIQRPYQYLKLYNQKQNLDHFNYEEGSRAGDPSDCLHHFLLYCGMEDPSWGELKNFSWFLNVQLKDCENSVFCDPYFLAGQLPGFKDFIVKFMILMARDFASPSLNTSDQSPMLHIESSLERDLVDRLTLRKRWENESHPYIFFNADHSSMSFLGFNVQTCRRQNALNAVDPHSGRVLIERVMTQELFQGLQRQRISLTEDFDQLPRPDKIKRISCVVGARKGIMDRGFDPDPTYELTADNVMKMLAIHMRFRCGIPVVIMGETGCGKTRLVRFLCTLQREERPVENMVLVKVHGGTTAEMVYRKVREAEMLAQMNQQRHKLDTILFFDEANTTEAIFAIKEILCDQTVKGEPLNLHSGLKIIAACNPYRKHSPEMVERLERAGLGYRVKADETKDRLGKVPLRQLVYRVHPLPPSMVSLVWDFGQLNDFTELSYIRQIVQKKVADHHLPTACEKIISNVLAASQKYMRSRKNECSFVSLRDVERSMKVLVWFYQHIKNFLSNYARLERNYKTLKCLILAVGVCYYPSLVTKEEYLEEICRYFPSPMNSAATLQEDISSCQDLFLQNIQTRETIAKNIALKENVFLMVVCIELRIPLFLVGKPGSSKSLAKTVVADAMQGQNSHCDLFRNLKQVHMVSFQCSPHSSPEGIIGTFRNCARFQKDKNMDEYVSVVVLDEIGLAEDSPQMPLKTLHPLLEDGCIDNDKPDPHMKVGFVGISNWALDPAKMNRGIFVSRWDPSEDELVETAKGICSSSKQILLKIKHLLPSLAKAFLDICSETSTNQFFGLRDYYSLIKMLFAEVKSTQQEPDGEQLVEAILRNFSGQPESFDPVVFFQEVLQDLTEIPRPKTLQMVKKNLDHDTNNESRYLLLLTTNNAALHILQQHVFAKGDYSSPEIIFGSGFPKDQEYAQICRNVNRVKTCMETGRTVILLNMQNLYESLYDALNQYYIYLSKQQYVDLGLGSHRVKCRVHTNFRLVVVEDQKKVYEHFPVPLINRLEKHIVDRSTDLELWQHRVLDRLREWTKEFSGEANEDFKLSDIFIGFHSDACASALLQALERRAQEAGDKEVFNLAKGLLLNCATPDAVVRLKYSDLSNKEKEKLQRLYFQQQHHHSLRDFLGDCLNKHQESSKFLEVTTFSSLLTRSDVRVLAHALGLHTDRILLLSLHQFDTEVSFCNKTRFRGFSASPSVWHSVHIDDLRDSEDMSLNLSAFCGTLISSLLRPALPGRTFTPSGLSLVRSCVQKAVGLLRDPDNVASRGMQRMNVLLTLLGNNPNPTGARFQSALLSRLAGTLAEREEMMGSPKEWVNVEAKKRQEFSLKHIKTAVLGSVQLDRQNQPGEPVGGNRIHARFLFKLNQTSTHLDLLSFKMCLCWFAVTKEGGAERILQFVSTFSSSRLGTYLQQLSEDERSEFGSLFLHDILLLSFNIKTKDELKVRPTLARRVNRSFFFQDSLLCSRAREEPGGEHRADIRFLGRTARKQTPDQQEDPAEFLLTVARLRICLSFAATLLHGATPAEAGEYLQQVRAVCEYSGDDWLRVYLLRALYRCSGLDSVLSLMNSPAWRWIFPAALLRLQVKINLFIVMTDKTSQRNLFYRAVCVCVNVQERARLEALLSAFGSEDFRKFCSSLLCNRIGGAGSPLHTSSNLPAVRQTVLELLVHLDSVLLCGNRLLVPLHQIAFQPENVTCGKPMVKSKCAECGAPVGGEGHIPTRTGHVLGEADRRSDAPERQMTSAQSGVLRLLTHLAMLQGAVRNQRRVGDMIHPRMSDVLGFLWKHLEKDVEVLGKSLGQNMDDTAVTVHLVLTRFPTGSRGERPDLSSKRGRQLWETLVCSSAIDPVLQVRNATADSFLNKSVWADICIKQRRRPMLSLPSNGPTHCSSFWTLQETMTVERFSQLVGETPGRGSFPLLCLFLKKVQTCAGMLSERVVRFFQVWNCLRAEVANNSHLGVDVNLCETELTAASSGEFLTPCRRGPGSCLQTLVDFLSETHNSLVRAARRVNVHEDRSRISETQLTLCHPERELLPLVLANCSYTLQKGGETGSSYDLPAIQTQLARRFLAGKPLIQLLTLSVFVFQEALKGSVSGAMRAALRSYTDVCDAVFVVEIGLRFLAKTGGDPEGQLLTFLTESLQMSPQVSNAGLGESKLQHSIVTWQLLNCWKSERMLDRKQDPFQKLPSEFQQKLTAEERRGLKAFFAVTDVDTFALELHEVLLLKTSSSLPDQAYQPHWDIRSTLEVHLEQKDLPPLLGLEELPEEIMLGKGADVWRAAVEFKRK